MVTERTYLKTAGGCECSGRIEGKNLYSWKCLEMPLALKWIHIDSTPFALTDMPPFGHDTVNKVLSICCKTIFSWERVCEWMRGYRARERFAYTKTFSEDDAFLYLSLQPLGGFVLKWRKVWGNPFKWLSSAICIAYFVTGESCISYTISKGFQMNSMETVERSCYVDIISWK